MIRRLLLLLVAAFVAWRWLRAIRSPAPQPPAPADPARSEGPMVRDRVCNTYLPRSRALVLGNGSDTVFFCSPACRDKHLAKLR